MQGIRFRQEQRRVDVMVGCGLWKQRSLVQQGKSHEIINRRMVTIYDWSVVKLIKPIYRLQCIYATYKIFGQPVTSKVTLITPAIRLIISFQRYQVLFGTHKQWWVDLKQKRMEQLKHFFGAVNYKFWSILGHIQWRLNAQVCVLVSK